MIVWRTRENAARRCAWLLVETVQLVADQRSVALKLIWLVVGRRLSWWWYSIGRRTKSIQWIVRCRVRWRVWRWLTVVLSSSSSRIPILIPVWISVWIAIGITIWIEQAIVRISWRPVIIQKATTVFRRAEYVVRRKLWLLIFVYQPIVLVELSMVGSVLVAERVVRVDRIVRRIVRWVVWWVVRRIDHQIAVPTAEVGVQRVACGSLPVLVGGKQEELGSAAQIRDQLGLPEVDHVVS